MDFEQGLVVCIILLLVVLKACLSSRVVSAEESARLLVSDAARLGKENLLPRVEDYSPSRIYMCVYLDNVGGCSFDAAGLVEKS